MGLYLSCERDFKASQLKKKINDYDLLLIGNSKSAIIRTAEIQKSNAFNAGIGGAKIEEIFYLIGRYIHKPIPLIIGIDLGQCDYFGGNSKISFRDSSGSTLHTDLDCLLSWRALCHSIECVKKFTTGQPRSVLENGTRNFKVLDPEDDKLAKIRLKKLAERFTNNKENLETKMSYFKALKTLLETRKIPYIVFIYPLNSNLLTELRKKTNYQRLEEWKLLIKEVFPNIVDLSESIYSNPWDYYKMDPEHYKPFVGSNYINNELLPKLEQN